MMMYQVWQQRTSGRDREVQTQWIFQCCLGSCTHCTEPWMVVIVIIMFIALTLLKVTSICS